MKNGEVYTIEKAWEEIDIILLQLSVCKRIDVLAVIIKKIRWQYLIKQRTRWIMVLS